MNHKTSGSMGQIDTASLRLVIGIFLLFVLYLACTFAAQVREKSIGSTCGDTAGGGGSNCFVFASKKRPEKSVPSSPIPYGKYLRWKIAQLERMFSVSFSRDGEMVDIGLESLAARAPRIKELAGLEAALLRAQPSQLDFCGCCGVKFIFLKETYHGIDDAVAFYLPNGEAGKPAVFFNPDAFDDEDSFEPRTNPIASGLFSVEAVIIHELSHNACHVAGGKKRVLPAGLLGWAKLDGVGCSCHGWILRGNEGKYYKRLADDSSWFLCDQNGQPLDMDAQPAGSENYAQQFSSKELRAKLEVEPITTYFKNPEEMFCEAMTCFRLGSWHRAFLLERSPELYGVIKEEDVREIERAYGTNRRGKPRYVRLPGGRLVKNTAKNRKLIESFENEHEPLDAEDMSDIFDELFGKEF